MTAAAQSPRQAGASMPASAIATTGMEEPRADNVTPPPDTSPLPPTASTIDSATPTADNIETGSTECPSQRHTRRYSQIQLAVPNQPSATAAADSSATPAAAHDHDSSASFDSSVPLSASPLLPRSNSHVHALRDSEDVGIILTDGNQQITHVNKTFSAITGYSASDSIGRNCNFLQGKHTSTTSRQRMRDSIQYGQTCQLAVLNYRKNGVPFWNLLTIAPMFGSDGRVSHYIGVQVPQSVVYVDRPMKLFAWHQGQSEQHEPASAGSGGGGGGLLVLPKQGGMVHARSMDWTREVREAGRGMGGRSNSELEIREVDAFGREPSPSMELMIQLPDSVDELEANVDDRSCARQEEKEEPADKEVDERKEAPSAQHQQQPSDASIHRLAHEVHNTQFSPTASSLPAPAPTARRPKALPSALSRATAVSFVAETLLPTVKGKYRVRAYKDLSPLGLRERREIMCVLYGDVEAAARSGASIALRVHDQCLTGDHRVMTRSGWKSISRVSDKDEVLSLNVDSYAVEWKPVMRSAISHQIDPSDPADTLYRMSGTGMDIIATRDHRMLVARSGGVTGLQRAEKGVDYETVGQLRKLRYTVSSTSTDTRHAYTQERAMVCAGTIQQPAWKVVIPGLERVCDWWWRRDQQSGFLQFLGFWLGDGSLNPVHGYVCIGHTKAAAVQWLETQLLPKVFHTWWRRDTGYRDPDSYTYVIRCPPLYEYLRLMAIGPAGFNPRDPSELRAYPHFTVDEKLVAEEQKSAYYERHAVSKWSEGQMLAAFLAATAAVPECCWYCDEREWEDGNEMVVCDGGCQRGGHLKCAGLTAVPEDNWYCPACLHFSSDNTATEGTAAAEGEETVCDVCGVNDSDSDGLLLLCDGCDRAVHSSCRSIELRASECLPAELWQVPRGDWYCDRCSAAPMDRQRLASDLPATEAVHAEEEEGPLVVEQVDRDGQTVRIPLAEGVADESGDEAVGAALRVVGKRVWWNNGEWIDLNGHWFHLKRWLGDPQQIARVYSRLSRQQAVALLDGFCRADSFGDSIRYTDDDDPTAPHAPRGVWRCTNSSFPLIDQLTLIGQLAGASVDLLLHTAAGATLTIGGRTVRLSTDHWMLSFGFTRPTDVSFQTAAFAEPVDVSSDVDGRGYYQHVDDGRVYCLRVQDNSNFLTQRLCTKTLRSGDIGVEAHAHFTGNCFTSEVLGSLKCDCRAQLDFAMHYIQHNTQRCGMIIYLSQEGRGIGLGNKIKAYSVQERGYDTVDANRVLGFPDDVREYSCVPSVLDGLGVRSVRLMTNNPRKTEALVSLGVNVHGRIPVVMEVNEHSDGYIRAKQSRMGHQSTTEET